jgi:hypothetical protein
MAPAIGWKAHAALARAAGRWTDLPGFAGSSYRLAGGEPIWIGSDPRAMHPRAVVLESLPPTASEAIDIGGMVPWRLAPLKVGARASGALRASAITLAAALDQVGVARGFAVILAGRQPLFPLHAVTPGVIATARAFDRDDARALHEAALPLLGLGAGLTPSGDDFVGAALFARRLSAMGADWEAVTRRLVDAAQQRTHAIGAALFADLAEGQSFDAMHRLAALMARTDAGPALHADVIAAARDVAAIGQSSGWDMLAGFIIGCVGSAALPARAIPEAPPDNTHEHVAGPRGRGAETQGRENGR